MSSEETDERLIYELPKADYVTLYEIPTPHIKEDSSTRYYVCDVSNMGEEHRSLRKRITGSIINAVLGESRFDTKDDAEEQIKGKKSKEPNENMLRGVRNEPVAIEWYSKFNNREVKRAGFGVSAEYLFLGGTPDGLTYDKDTNQNGLIEVKCPAKMYAPLVEKMIQELDDRWQDGYCEYKCEGSRKQTIYPPRHIWLSHYQQMQMYMAIWGRPWCDYIVYASDSYVYQERVYCNNMYWEEHMLPGAIKFYEERLS